MNILHVYDHLKFGGAETSIITLLKGFYENGHNVFLATPRGEALALIEDYISWIELPEISEDNVIEVSALLMRTVINNKIEVVHAHPFISQKNVALLSLVCPVPIITTVHGNYTCPSTNYLLDFYSRQIVVSEEIKNRISHLQLSNVEVIPNSINFNCDNMQPRSIRSSNLISLLYVSRIDEEKKAIFEFLIDFLKQSNNVELKIVGQGNYLENLINIVGKLPIDIKRKIKIEGGVANPRRLMLEADLVLGVGRVLLESVSVNVPFLVLGEKGYGGKIDSHNLDKFLHHNLTERGLHITPYSENRAIDRLKNDVSIQLNSSACLDTHEIFNTIKKNNSLSNSVANHLKEYSIVIREFKGKQVEDEVIDLKGVSNRINQLTKFKGKRNSGLEGVKEILCSHYDALKINETFFSERTLSFFISNQPLDWEFFVRKLSKDSFRTPVYLRLLFVNDSLHLNEVLLEIQQTFQNYQIDIFNLDIELIWGEADIENELFKIHNSYEIVTDQNEVYFYSKLLMNQNAELLNPMCKISNICR